MKLINIYDAIRAVDRHMLEDGTLDNDISCILEEVTPVMIPQKASSSCSHEKDTISRQAAIEAIKEDKIDLTNPNVVAVFKSTGDFEKVETQVMTCDRHIEILKGLPSTQPDSLVRPSARWMSVGHKRARICSRCFRDEPYKFADHDADVYDFCPHCGADMREVSE